MRTVVGRTLPELTLPAVTSSFHSAQLSAAYERVAQQAIVNGTSDPIFPAGVIQNPEECYQACLVALDGIPTFYYNFYTLLGAQQPICSCVKDFKLWWPVPAGAAYLVCPGEDPNGVLGVRTKVNTLLVEPGKVLKWSAQVTNLDKTTTLEGMGFQVSLPPYTRTVRPRTSSRGAKPKLEPQVFTNESAVVWEGFSLTPGKHRLFQLTIAVVPWAPVNTALNLNAFIFMTAGNPAEMVCPYSANDLTVSRGMSVRARV